MNKTITQLLCKLKEHSIKKKTEFSFAYSLLTEKYLKLLYQEGLILSYKKKGNELVVFLKSVDNNVPTKTIKIISKPKKDKIFSFVDIVKTNVKNRSIFFSTKFGLLSLEDCKKKRTGGLALFSC